MSLVDNYLQSPDFFATLELVEEPLIRIPRWPMLEWPNAISYDLERQRLH
jgi:hypothetical protein